MLVTGGLHEGDGIPVYNSGLNQDVISEDVGCTGVMVETVADEGVDTWLGSGGAAVVQLAKTSGRQTTKSASDIIVFIFHLHLSSCLTHGIIRS
jgi:hypothetical protein